MRKSLKLMHQNQIPDFNLLQFHDLKLKQALISLILYLNNSWGKPDYNFFHQINSSVW